MLLLLALAPSLIWLGFYLRQDAHPEPKRFVMKTFIAGMMAAVLAAFAEWIILCSFFLYPNCAAPDASFSLDLLPALNLDPAYPLTAFASGFFGIALIEESAKLLAVRFTILRSRYFDEPIDAMIYLIIAALGFATVENVLVIFQGDVANLAPPDLARLLLLRFLGATFLHTTAAGFTGYFLSRSFFPRQPKTLLLIVGLCVASLSHWLYNAFIDQLAAEATIRFDVQTFFNLLVLLVLSGVIIISLLKHLRLVSLRHEFITPHY